MKIISINILSFTSCFHYPSRFCFIYVHSQRFQQILEICFTAFCLKCFLLTRIFHHELRRGGVSECWRFVLEAEDFPSSTWWVMISSPWILIFTFFSWVFTLSPFSRCLDAELLLFCYYAVKFLLMKVKAILNKLPEVLKWGMRCKQNLMEFRRKCDKVGNKCWKLRLKLVRLNVKW